MQWKSIIKDGLPDAKEVLLSYFWRGENPGWRYVSASRFEETGEYRNADGLVLKISDVSEPTYACTHYLILEPPEVE